MTYTTTKETLELAALACGFVVLPNELCDSTGIVVRSPIEGRMFWEPSISKADLLDMMLAAEINWQIYDDEIETWALGGDVGKIVTIANGNKHAALAEAALKVAAMVGAKMKEQK